MGKTSVSVSMDMNCYIKVRELANKSFHKNFSKCMNWLIYSCMRPENFYRFQAKYHAQQLEHFRELLLIEESQDKGKCKGVAFINL